MSHHALSALKSITAISRETDSVILFCSLGKDSLVLLDLVAPRFKRVVCVFMYFVQGLDHIDRYVRYVCSKYPNVEWLEIPHWSMTYVLRHGLYCEPQPDIKLLKLTDTINIIREETGLRYVFLGMKASDSMNRNLIMKGCRENNYERNGLVYPLAEWKTAHIASYIRQNRIIEPVRYSRNNSGGLGFNKECFLWMREHAPQDLEKVLKAFPLSERILYEHDRVMEAHSIASSDGD